MATSTPRRRTPPVNAELYKIERSGARIWTGSAPAFATRSQEWVPTSTGAAVPVGEYTVTVPILLGPAEGEPDDPDFPVDPDEVDPPPPPVGDEEHPYEPPDELPEVDDPDPDTYQAALAGRPGYAPADTDTVPGATNEAPYLFNASGVTPVPAGYCRFIDDFRGSPTGLVTLRPSKTDVDSEPFNAPGSLDEGALLRIESLTDPTKWAEYALTADATDGGSYWGLSVEYVTAGATGLGLDNATLDGDTFRLALAVGPPVVQDVPFRPRFYVVDDRDTWEYDISQGGLHYSLGAGDAGIVDRTGNDRHGSPIAVTLGSTAGKLANGDESTYFNGVDSRIVTPWDPFADFGHPPLPPAEFYDGPPFETDYGLWYAEYSATGAGPTYAGGTGWTGSGYPEWRIVDGATRVIQVSGWARRQDRSNGHLLFSHTGFEGPRCWVAQGSNDVCLCFAPQHRTSLGQRLHQGGWWSNAWATDDQWTHFLFEIREPGGTPLFRRRRNVGGVVTYEGRYSLLGGYSSAPIDPFDPDELWDIYPYEHGWDRRTSARLWINGALCGPAGIYDSSGNPLVESGSGSVATDWVPLNRPAAVTLPPDPDREDWPWIGPNGEDCRPFQRGHLMVSGVALPTPTAELYPDLFDWATVEETLAEFGPRDANPYYGEKIYDDRPERSQGGGLWREGRRASAWKGSIDEFAVHKWEQRVTTVDLGIRPASSVWPGATLPQLVGTDPPAPVVFGATAADAPSVTPATVVDVPEGQVQIIPRVGDRAYWRHAGQTFAKTIDGIEEREDYGFYRLFSRRGE